MAITGWGGQYRDGAPVPSQIADKLRGKTFGSFDSFRRAFWKAVADDSALSKQFSEADINQMKAGRAPTADFLESVGKRVKIELHHEKEISQGGAVMDVDNIKALTPKIILRHIKENKMAGNKISDFTEEEFTAFVSKIIAADFQLTKRTMMLFIRSPN